MPRLTDQESKSRPHLSRREGQVLSLLKHGLSNKEIAVELGIAPTTVSQYLHVLFIKLGVQNRTQLALRSR